MTFLFKDGESDHYLSLLPTDRNWAHTIFWSLTVLDIRELSSFEVSGFSSVEVGFEVSKVYEVKVSFY